MLNPEIDDIPSDPEGRRAYFEAYLRESPAEGVTPDALERAWQLGIQRAREPFVEG